ncbi:MAG: hypothetical protein QNJ20_11900 [Paracoccaceae bacterium]|nr:hypothetical protein [Paracoccaceae bacterium]
MTHLIRTFALFVLLCAPAHARDLLPVALGHQSAAFVVDGKKAPLPIGARVEFTYKDENGMPKRLPFASSLVLGTQDNVVFFELSNRNAAALAIRRSRSEVSYRKIKDPVPEEVAVRLEYRDNGNAIRLAPQMRRLTVTMTLDPEIVSTWSPGETLTFFDARERTTRVKVNGTWKPRTTYRNVKAMFRSATETADGQFEVTLVADPHDANHLLRAELEDRLTVDPETAPSAKQLDEKRCFVVQRVGNARTELPIPCRN